MNREIEINKFDNRISFINRGIGFSQVGVANEILNLIDDLQQENKQLKAKIDKAKHYIYFHSTQRKMFISVSDRFHNQEIQFKGRIEDLLEILGDKENEKEKR